MTTYEVATLSDSLPALYAPNPAAARRTLEFFTANIRNLNTRKAYARAGVEFARCCQARGIEALKQIEPVHVAAYIEQLQVAAPSVKQRLAALRTLFDWLVVGQVMLVNPAVSLRGPHAGPDGVGLGVRPMPAGAAGARWVRTARRDRTQATPGRTVAPDDPCPSSFVAVDDEVTRK